MPESCTPRRNCFRVGISAVAGLCLLFGLESRAMNVMLGWNKDTSTNTSGYYLYYGNASGNYTNRLNAGAGTNATISSLSSNLTYYFAVTAYNTAGTESVPSNEATFSTGSQNPTNSPPANPSPVITGQPASLTVNAGASATFTVTATGNGLAYQWNKNGTAISGATTSLLTLGNVATTDAAGYSATVTNSAGTVTSSAAILTVNASSSTAPVITAQPVSLTNNAGTTATFFVGTLGAAPSYTFQWFKNSAPIAGATGYNLTLANVSDADAAAYTAVVSNVSGSGSTTSQVATLTVIDAAAPKGVSPSPAITAQPLSRTNNAGTTATFNVGAAGTGLGYLWYRNGVAIGGATASQLTLTAVSDASAGSYTVTVNNGSGAATSSAATLTVIDPPVITSQPASRAVNAGATATFTVKATGTRPSYQWRKNGAIMAGATTSALTLTNVALANAGSYTVTLANAAGTVTSGTATLTLAGVPSITSQPLSRTNNAGTTATFSAGTSGSSLKYQWRKNGAAISGATSSLLTLKRVADASAGSYTVSVTNSAGTALSAAAILTVIDPPVITAQPASRTNTVGTTASLTVTANGSRPSYQWRKNGASIPGATAATLTLTNVALTDAASYTVRLANAAGTATSATAVLTVLNAPAPLFWNPSATGPAPLTVTPPANPGGPVRVTFTVPQSSACALQATADLQTWSTLWQTNSAAADAQVSFDDAAAGVSAMRFYRLNLY